MSIPRKLFDVSYSKLAVRFGAMANFFFAALLSLVLLFIFEKKSRDIGECIWLTKKFYFTIQKSLHPQPLIVWCELSSRAIVGALFLEQTITSVLYLELLKNQSVRVIQNEPDLDSMWFMQDGALLPRANKVFYVFEEYFNKRFWL